MAGTPIFCNTFIIQNYSKYCYEYIIHNRGRGQIIIVDNLNALPDMDFEDEDVNVIIYHKNEKDGHVYGFMPSWRKDIPNEK